MNEIPHFILDADAGQGSVVPPAETACGAMTGEGVELARCIPSPVVRTNDHGYTPGRPPLLHQSEGLQKLSPKTAAAFLMEFGTGKSFMTVTNVGELWAGGEITGAVILAPKGNYDDWTTQDPETSHWLQSVSPELRERLMLVQWRGGNTQREKKGFAALHEHRGFSVLVVNTEALSGNSKKAEALVAAFLKSRRCLLACDESTLLRSPSSNRTKAAVRLAALAPYRRILTGLPTPRGSLDLYSQFQFLDWRILGHTSFWTYRARYAVLRELHLGSRTVKTVVGYKNTSELWQKIEPYSYRVRADDCLDLPEATYRVWSTEMTDDQRKVYEGMRDEALAAVGDQFASATSVITQMLRLHQVANGFITVEGDGGVVRLPHRKTTDLLEALDFSGEQKAVIWAHYHACVDEIVELLSKEYGPQSVVQYHGNVPDDARREARERFAGDPDCRWFVGTQATGGRGLNDLVVARAAFYYANSFDLELRLNSEARTRRKGSERHSSVSYTDMITTDTVESKIVYALRRKLDVASLVVADGPRSWLV